MGSIIDRLASRQLIQPPGFLRANVQYEVIMGSVAYGVSSDNSDMDIYGFCIPPKNVIFPHLDGVIQGFGKQHNRFEQWQHHHIIDPSAKKEYDFTIYSIIKYFQLCMQNNPNMIDSLFVPRRCILHSTFVGELVRENRKLFLHKGAWHKFKGYAYSQVHKMQNKDPEKGSSRYSMVQKYGYDLKFAYHVVRLLNEVEQILIEHDLDLERNREQLKSIRRGEWTVEQIINYFDNKEKSLEELYITSTLQHSPNEDKIKALLLQCLEHHYGSLEDAIKSDVTVNSVLDEMQMFIDKIRKTTK